MNCGAVGSSRRTWGPAIRDGGAKQQVGAKSLLQRTSRCSSSARADTLRSSLPFLFLSSPAQKVLELFDKELERVSSLSARVCFARSVFQVQSLLSSQLKWPEEGLCRYGEARNGYECYIEPFTAMTRACGAPGKAEVPILWWCCGRL